MVRMPRRLHLGRGREARPTIAQVVPLDREPPGRVESPDPGQPGGPPVETLGRRLRRKIERNPEKPEVIKTVRGIGYMYVKS